MLRIVGLDLQEMMYRVNERACRLCTKCKIVFLQLPICLCFSFGVSIAFVVYVIHFVFFSRNFSLKSFSYFLGWEDLFELLNL